MNYLEGAVINIEEPLKKIYSAGGKLYLVGGTVRDLIMEAVGVAREGAKPKDFDFCVTGLSQEDFERIFPDAKVQGKDFPVYIINKYEVALVRKERKVGEGHRGFQITTSSEFTIEDDLIRRDITINSIAYDILARKVIDPFGGIDDIENKVIRATSEAFKEDALRVYRVARFASKFGFSIEPSTIEMMKSLKQELNTISPERVFDELRKGLGTKYPSRFFEVLKEAEVLDVHFKEIANLVGVEQPKEHHPEGDVFMHTMVVLNKTAKMTTREEVRYAALVHDLGKGVTDPSLWPKHHGHDKAGVPLVCSLSRRLKVPSLWEKAGKTAAEYHMKAGRFDEMKPNTKVTFLEKNLKHGLGLDGLEIVANADAKPRGMKVEFANIGRRMIKEVNGKTIENLTQGKAAGEKIHGERVKWMKTELLKKQR